jgi:hypothetical protein
MSKELTELYAARGVDISKSSVISIHSMPTSVSILREAGFGDKLFDGETSRKMDDDGVLHLPDLGLDPVAIIFDESVAIARGNQLMGALYSKSAGRCDVVVRVLDNDAWHVVSYPVYDANISVAEARECADDWPFFCPDGGLASPGGRMWSPIVYALTVAACAYGGRSKSYPSFTDKHNTKKLRKVGIVPRPYYTLRLKQVRVEGSPRKGGNGGRALAYRHKRKGHERLRVRYVSTKDTKRIWAMRKRGYLFYRRRQLTGEVITKLADRSKRMPDEGEMVAIHTTVIKESMVGDDSLPFVPSLRVL